MKKKVSGIISLITATGWTVYTIGEFGDEINREKKYRFS